MCWDRARLLGRRRIKGDAVTDGNHDSVSETALAGLVKEVRMSNPKGASIFAAGKQ